MLDALSSLGTGGAILLIVALAIAFGFECINGFHDTANAVATVIYTKSMKPTPAVVWSGVWNFIGVHAGGIGVAFSIVHLLPVDLLVNIKTGRGLAMVLSLLGAAIVWNFATWYRGLPASSSHALVGSIMGVGMMNSLLENGSISRGINWHKAAEVGTALLLSPLVGFCLAATTLTLCRFLVRSPKLYAPPVGDEPPPWWVRALLIGTCTGVSFAHGSNDGQKGMGLVMLVLIGIVPAAYALDMHLGRDEVAATVAAARTLGDELRRPDVATLLGALRDQHLANARVERLSREEIVSAAEASLDSGPVDTVFDPFPSGDVVLATLDPVPLADAVVRALGDREGFGELSAEERWEVRTHLVELGASLRTLVRQFGERLPDERKKELLGLAATIARPVEYVPEWVVMAVALCLGLGTMVGWERIVVTVGEKIGKEHLTYAQGGAAELVAATTIALADRLGMPVSTTHVLSSGIAGTMWANRSGIDAGTARSILLAWVLTLPAVIALAAGFYWLATRFVA
ncbi:MAG: inorganic phosphate transporter [Planctomycetaceae bacterium]